MKSANPYLFVDRCRETMAYYQKILGGEIKNVAMSDGIAQFQGQEGKVLHAELHVGDSVIHFSDTFGSVSKGTHVSVTLELESEEEIRKVYEALADGGRPTVELQETFWEALHANVTDKHGVGWLLNYQKSGGS